jgi:hypothetical protein
MERGAKQSMNIGQKHISLKYATYNARYLRRYDLLKGRVLALGGTL